MYKKENYDFYILSICSIVVLVLVYRLVYVETFRDKVLEDGKLKYDYLTNQGYTESVLSRYYINDNDVFHPYQYTHTINGRDKFYGKPRD